MLRLATSSDLPGITALWQEAFGDSPGAVSDFFRSFPGCLSYVAEEQGSIVSMIHALPQVLSPDTQASYIYAVATRKSHRGKGLCRRLMAFAEADLTSRGFACAMLTPGEPELFDFYTALGYETVFIRNRTAAVGGTPVSAEDYHAIREQLLTVPHVIYDVPTLEYAQRCYDLTFYRTEAGCCAASADYTAEVLPEDLGGSAFAMVKWLGKPQVLQNAYLGFALE